MSLETANMVGVVFGLLLVLLSMTPLFRDQKSKDFCLILGISLMPLIIIPTALNRIMAMRHERIDLYLNAIDGYFFYPANHMARLIAHQPLLSLCKLDYAYWWAPPIAALLLLSRHDLQQAWRAFFSFFISGLLAVPFYFLAPASGPLFVFRNFPDVYKGPVHLVRSSFEANCIPSVHFTLAAMTLWFLWRWKAGRLLGCIHVGFTTMATLGLGQHYFVDLLLALPFTWMVVSIPRIWERRRSVAAPAKACVEPHAGTVAEFAGRIDADV